MKETTLAYAAGVMDGEGYIGIVRARRYSRPSYFLVVCVKMKVTSGIPKFMHQNFGGHYYETVYEYRPLSPTGSYEEATWNIAGNKAKEFLKLIQPYLIDKAEKAKVALDFPIGGKGPTPRTDIEYQLQEACFDLIKY